LRSIAATPTTSAAVTIVNASDSKMAGFELSASGKLDGGFHWSADTTYTRIRDMPFGAYNLVNRNIAFSKTTPKFRGNVAAGWSESRWTADVYARYVTGYDAYSPAGGLVRTPAYVSLAGRVGYQISDGLTAALSGQNLGSPRQIQGMALGLQAERRVLVSLSKSW